MKKLPLLLFIFLIPLIMASDWCEYQPLDIHKANSTKGSYIDVESSTFTSNNLALTDWNCYIAYNTCNTIVAPECPFGDSNPCLSITTGGKANITLPYNYCPNMTIQFNYKGSGNIFNSSICDNWYSGSGTGIKTITNIVLDQSCSNQTFYLETVETNANQFDNFNFTCNFAKSNIGGGITDEFYAYPKVFTENGITENETYPNVTYKIRLNMTDFNPSCSDTDNINKYGFYVLPQTVYPNIINWYKQTQSCKEVGNQSIEQPHYSWINQTMQGGCKALVNYQNATMNCELIKYNTTIGSDVPTIQVLQPTNSSLLINPILFSLTTSNNKCSNVYVLSTNQQTGYNKLTILTMDYTGKYTGSETLPNGTYVSNFICSDGCSGINQHTVNATSTFSVSSEYITGGGTISYLNGTSCDSGWVNLGEKAFCYTPEIKIPSYCSNIEVKETTSIEYDNYLTSCDSDGGLFNNGKFNMTSCTPTATCGSGNYYCNETANTKSKTSLDYLSGQIATGYSEGYVPLDCRCPTSILSSWLGGYRINKFRVSGHLEMSCISSCTGNWICSSSKTKAYMNTSCEITNSTPCSYECKDGICITQSGSTDTGQTTGLGGFYSLIYHPSASQKMVMGFGGCILFGIFGLFLSKSFGDKKGSLLFLVMFGVGFSMFTYLGWIPAILIVMIIFFSGIYVLSKLLM